MLPTHHPLSRRQFISTSTAVLGSYSHSLPGLSASPLPQRPSKMECHKNMNNNMMGNNNMSNMMGNNNMMGEA